MSRGVIRRAGFPSLALIAACTTATLSGWAFDTHLTQSIQSKTKVMGKAPTRNAVVDFDEISVSGKRINAEEAFAAGDDWLSTVFFRVKNISTKPVVYLEVNVNFPETKKDGPMSSFVLSFGKKPASRFPQLNAPLFIPPTATFDIPLADSYPKMKGFVEKRKAMKTISRADVEIGFVIFEDATGWAAGNFYKQDPDNPDRYRNIGDRPSN